jgi:hypothetical protein
VFQFDRGAAACLRAVVGVVGGSHRKNPAPWLTDDHSAQYKDFFATPLFSAAIA